VQERPRYRETFIRLLGFLRPYKWTLWVSVALALVSQAAQFVTAYLTGTAVANAVHGNDRHALDLVVVAVVLVGLTRALAMMGRRLIAGKQALGVELDMRSALYAHLLRLSFGFYDQHQTGQLMSRATVDLQTVRFFLGYGLVFFFQNVLTVIGAGVVMFVVNWRLALVSLWIAPLLVGLAYR
jgi:ABC-type multidrug transport system fused ATPase/permease subunit